MKRKINKKKHAIVLSYQILQYVYKTRNEESFFQIDLKKTLHSITLNAIKRKLQSVEQLLYFNTLELFIRK